jgi:hypothetical protein
MFTLAVRSALIAAVVYGATRFMLGIMAVISAILDSFSDSTPEDASLTSDDPPISPLAEPPRSVQFHRPAENLVEHRDQIRLHIQVVAGEARDLPAEHRREIFELYRDQIIAYATQQLDQHGDGDQVLDSVTKLLSALDISGVDHEASYIVGAAEQRLPSPLERFERDYRRHMSELQQRHSIRSQAIREAGIEDPELVERLLDAEDTLLQNALLNLALPDEDPLPQLEVPVQSQDSPAPLPDTSLGDKDE